MEPFGNLSTQQGGDNMSKAPNWTLQDEQIGKELLARAKNFDHKQFDERTRLTKAAWDMKYSGGISDSALSGARKYINSLKIKPKTKEKEEADFVKYLEKSYKNELKNNPDFRHANTHPDDEK